MSTSEYKFIAKIFFSWLIVLFIVLFFAVKFLPSQQNFLGGGYVQYSQNPYFWAWGNFDGEHYVTIAQTGYGYGQRAFFPLYPLSVKYLGLLIGGSQAAYHMSGILISLVALFIGLIGFYKLLRLDFSEKFSKLCLIFLLLFPTSFYFASIYTESLFFSLSVWAFYFVRRKDYPNATLMAMFLTATRFVGIIIIPALLIEWYLESRREKINLKKLPWILAASPLGLLAYMYYLDRTVHDKFAFFSNLALFGEQRSTHLIVLPQVFYRYIFKILPSLNTSFFPIIFTTFFEFAVGLFYFLFSLIAFFRIRLSYAAFLFFGYLIPTFSGSFSSLPRYVLVLFPAILLFVGFVHKSKLLVLIFSFVSSILLIVSFALFARGYWLS